MAFHEASISNGRKRPPSRFDDTMTMALRSRAFPEFCAFLVEVSGPLFFDSWLYFILALGFRSRVGLDVLCRVQEVLL